LAEPTPEVAVGAVCVRDGRLLLVQRGRGVSAGAWSLPGGRLEPGETLEQAVVRELAEETRLAGRVLGLAGLAERRSQGHHYVILDYWVEAHGDPVAGDDARDVIWASLADLERLPLVSELAAWLSAHDVTSRLH
jgi:ADP-ribose pyrophosphatase YjhB (NUDIX family)